MSNEIIIPGDVEYAHGDVAKNLARERGAFGMFKNDVMDEIMEVRSAKEVETALRNQPLPTDNEFYEGDESHKIDALARFGENYLPMGEAVTFTQRALSKFRLNYVERSFYTKSYLPHYFGQRKAVKGSDAPVLPPNISSLQGMGMVMAGPSQVGRTALITRIQASLPQFIELEGELPCPTEMICIPCFRIEFPTCGTSEGFFRDFRSNLLAILSKTSTSEKALIGLLGPNAENAAIAYATLFNFGMLVIDGLSARAVNPQTSFLLEFLVKFKRLTNIPVVLSGTTPFMHAAGLLGSTSSNMFNGPAIHMQPLKRPSKHKKKVTGVWHQMNLWYWSCGVISPKYPMPEELSVWTHELTLGRVGWLAQGFEALHVAVARNHELITNPKEKLTLAKIAGIFEPAIRMSAMSRGYLLDIEDDADLIHSEPTEFMRNLDHMTYETIGSYSWLKHSKMKVPWLGA